MTERHHPLVETTLQSYGIKLGAPVRTQTPAGGVLDVSHSPHVFFFQDLYIVQPHEHLEALVEQLPNLQNNLRHIESSNLTLLHLKNLMGIMAHGLVTGPRPSNWVFSGTRKSIDETVHAYEKVADTGLLPQLDIVVACKSQRQNIPNLSVGMRKRPYISAGDFIEVINPIDLKDERPYKYIPQIREGQGASAVLQASKWFSINTWLLHNHWWDGSGAVDPQVLPEWSKSIAN